MHRLAMLSTILLGGCDFTISRPDQDNFTIHASQQRAERLVQNLSKRFDASVDATHLDGLGNDPSRMFDLYGTDATLVIIQVPDDRCDTNAPTHATFNQGEYRIDLVYKSTSEAKRGSARRALFEAAHEEGIPIAVFNECPLVADANVQSDR